MIIYLIRNKISGKCYIGQTIGSLHERWLKHVSTARGKCRIPIALAIRSYGKENFEVSLLDRASSLEELNNLESQYIKQYGSMVPRGYNLQVGGNNHRAHPDTIEKCRKASMGNRHNDGRAAVTEETRLRMREAAKNKPLRKPHSDEARRKMSLKALDRPRKKGWKHDQEALKLMSRNRQNPDICSQEICQLYLSGMSGSEVSKRLGVNVGTVYWRLRTSGIKRREPRPPKGVYPNHLREYYSLNSSTTKVDLAS